MHDPRPLSKYDDPELELFVRSGRTIAEIAALYGFHEDDVATYLRRRRPMIYEQAVASQAAKDRAKAQSSQPQAGTPPGHTPPHTGSR